MEGTTKTFSRVAGFLNIAAALFLVVVVVFFFTLGNFGILTKAASESSSESEESTPETDEEQKSEANKALGIVFAILLFLPLILIMLVPLGIINVIEGLIFGSHCLKAPPKTGAVIFSLILKILTLPTFGMVIVLLAGLTDVSDAAVPALFPALIAGYLVTLVVAHVFEWMANRSALRDRAAPTAYEAV